MRKSTLLLGLLVAGCAAAADTYIVPEVSTADAPKYYKVVSNRALTLQYANLYNSEGVVLATQNTAVAPGEGTYGNRPYIGLLNLDQAAISWDSELVPDASLLWRFEAADDNTEGTLAGGGVYWINLFSPDMKLNAKGNTSDDVARLSEKGSPIYVFNLNGYSEGENAFLNNTYSINSQNDVFAYAGFDTKNRNASSNPEHPYTFIGSNWQPFNDFQYNKETKTFGVNPNANNGCAFYFVAATDEEVAAAKVELAKLEEKILIEQGPTLIEEAKAAYNDATVGFANVPALWAAADINAAKAKIAAQPLTIEGLSSLKELRSAIENYEEACDGIIAELTAKAAGKVVTFRNVGRYYQGVEGEPCYLGFGESTTFDEETGEEITVSGIMALDEDNTASQWEIIAAKGGLKLKNAEYDIYPSATVPATYIDWGYTASIDSAAVMQLAGVDTTDETILAGLTEVENVVGIGIVGKSNSAQTWMHAAGAGTNYNIVSWTRADGNGTPEYNSASNWFVSVVGTGSIATVATDNVEAVNAIYDLSGRQINAITRSGLYIINGKKVIVKK